jgi:hypothetical protein
MKAKIEQILVRHDPIGLIKMGAPQDEYDSEAQMICERTTKHFSREKIHQIIHEVFVHQFDDGKKGLKSIAGPYDNYKAIALEIKALLDS